MDRDDGWISIQLEDSTKLQGVSFDYIKNNYSKTISIGGVKYMSKEFVGAGSLGLVFKAKRISRGDGDGDGENNGVGEVIALKIARPEKPDAVVALINEFEALKKLETVDDRGYFPRVYYPDGSDLIADQDYYDGGKQSFIRAPMIAMEFVAGQNLVELIDYYSWEPLMILIFEQYLEATCRAAYAGIITTDRKLDNIVWQWKQSAPLLDKKNFLLALQRGEDLGQVKVIDWNVYYKTREKDDLTKRSINEALPKGLSRLEKDFVRVFSKNKGGRSVEIIYGDNWIPKNIDELAGYLTTKTYWTRKLIIDILSRRDPETGSSKVTVGETIESFRRQLKLFSLAPEELLRKAKIDLANATRDQIEEAFACIDTLRVMIQDYGMPEPDNFGLTYRSLARALLKDSLSTIINNLKVGRWAAPEIEIDNLRRKLYYEDYYLGKIVPRLQKICQVVRNLYGFGPSPNIEELIDFTLRREDLSPGELQRLDYLVEVWKNDLYWGPVIKEIRDQESQLVVEMEESRDLKSSDKQEKQVADDFDVCRRIIEAVVDSNPTQIPFIREEEKVVEFLRNHGVSDALTPEGEIFTNYRKVYESIYGLLHTRNSFGIKAFRDDLLKIINSLNLPEEQASLRDEIIKRIETIASQRLSSY